MYLKSLVLISVFLLFGCKGIDNENNYQFSQAKGDPLLIGGYLFEAKSSQRESCPPGIYMVTHEVSSLTQAIAAGGRLDFSNDDLALAILDSMQNGKSAETRRFYFWIVTKTLEHSDGYYAEGVGNCGTSFLFKQPNEFLEVWGNCINAEEQRFWVWALEGEQYIINEGRPVELVQRLFRHRLDSVGKHLPRSLVKVKRSLNTRIDTSYSALVKLNSPNNIN